MGDSGTGKSRTGLYVLIGMTSVFLLSVIGLFAYFTEERLKGLLVPVFEAATNRKVRLERIGLSIWGGVKASVEGLSVSDRKGFGEADFLRARRASFSMAFLPLLMGEVKLGEVTIENPSISLVIDRKGEANYSDLQGETSSSESESASGGGFLLQSVRIQDGVLRYEDRLQGSVTSIDGLDYEASWELRKNNVRLEGRLSVEQVAHGSQSEGTSLKGLFLSHRLSIELGTRNTTLESIEIGVGDLSLNLRGWIRGGEKARVMVEVQEKMLQMADLSEYLGGLGVLTPGTRLMGALRVVAKAEGSWMKGQGTVGLPNLSVGLVAEGLTMETPDLLESVTDLNVEIVLEHGEVVIKRINAKAGRSDFSASGRIAGFLASLMSHKPVRPMMTLKLRSNVLDLNELIPLEGETSLIPDRWTIVPSVYAAKPIQGIPSPLPPLLRAMEVDGDLEFDELKSGGTVLNDFKMAAKSRNGILKIRNIAGKVYGGKLSGEAEMDARIADGQYPVKANIAINGAQAGEMLREVLGWSVQLQGDLGLDLGFTGAVDSTLEVVYSHLSARGKAGMGRGKIINWGLLKKAASQVSQLGFMNFDEIQIRDLVAPFTISDGRLVFADVKFSAADLECSLSGTTGLDKNLDYILDVDLPPTRLNVGGLKLGNALGSFLGDSGPIPLRLKISGTAEYPEVSASLRAASGRSRGGKIQKQDSLEEKAKGLLKKLF